MAKIEKDFWGNHPQEHESLLGSDKYIKIDGTSYRIIRRSGNNNKFIVREESGLFGGEEKVVEKNLIGEWILRNKGMFD